MTSIREWVRGAVCLGFGLGGLAVAPPVQARSLTGSSEVQLKTSLFSYTSSKGTSHTVNAPPGQAVPEPTASSQTSSNFSLLGSGSGLTYGYFLTEHLELGAGVLISHGHTNNPDFGSSNYSAFSLLPRVAYVFGSAAVRPYIAGSAGYQHSWGSGDSNSFHSSSRASGFHLGAALGAHVFVTDSCSFDPEISVQRLSSDGTGTSTSVGSAAPFSDDTEGTSRATTLMLSVGMSGWFGGR